MLFFGIMQDQPELHALAGELAVAQGAHAGENGTDADAAKVGPRLAALLPIPDHLLEVGHQQVNRRLQVLRAAIAIAVRTGLEVIVGRRPLARTRSGAVQILSPEQELDRVIPGRDIGLDPARLVETADHLRRQLRQVDALAVDLKRRARNDIGCIETVLVALGAVGGIDIVDQPLIQRPGVHPALPVVHDRVAEPERFGLLVGWPCGLVRSTCRVQRGRTRRRKQRIHRHVQGLGSRQRILVSSEGDVGIGFKDSLGRRAKSRSCRNAQQEGRVQSHPHVVPHETPSA